MKYFNTIIFYKCIATKTVKAQLNLTTTLESSSGINYEKKFALQICL